MYPYAPNERNRKVGPAQIVWSPKNDGKISLFQNALLFPFNLPVPGKIGKIFLGYHCLFFLILLPLIFSTGTCTTDTVSSISLRL